MVYFSYCKSAQCPTKQNWSKPYIKMDQFKTFVTTQSFMQQQSSGNNEHYLVIVHAANFRDCLHTVLLSLLLVINTKLCSFFSVFGQVIDMQQELEKQQRIQHHYLELQKQESQALQTQLDQCQSKLRDVSSENQTLHQQLTSASQISDRATQEKMEVRRLYCVQVA